MTEPSMCGSEVALRQITLTTCYYYNNIQKTERTQQDCRTHVPRPDEDGDTLDLRIKTVHVLELLDQLTEVLALAHVLEHVCLLLATRDLYVQSTVVCRSLD